MDLRWCSIDWWLDWSRKQASLSASPDAVQTLAQRSVEQQESAQLPGARLAGSVGLPIQLISHLRLPTTPIQSVTHQKKDNMKLMAQKCHSKVPALLWAGHLMTTCLQR